MTDNDTYTAHVIPQSVARGTAFVTCTLDDGRNFTCTLQNDVEWQAGGEYTYEISLIAAGAGYIYDDATHTYTVHNADGLLAWDKAVRYDRSLNCTLAADITMPAVADGESNWTPVGDGSIIGYEYTGTFDGGGHTITGLTIDLSRQNYVGLFSAVGQTGTVKNLTLAGAKITGFNRVGGVAGGNTGTVENCRFISGIVSGSTDVGGVAGANYDTVTGCYATGTLSGYSQVGGVVGGNYTGTVTACYWSSNLDAGIGDGSGDVTQVDGTTVTWVDAVGEMNSVLNSLTTWYYELVGDNLPVLMQRQ